MSESKALAPIRTQRLEDCMAIVACSAQRIPSASLHKGTLSLLSQPESKNLALSTVVDSCIQNSWVMMHDVRMESRDVISSSALRPNPCKPILPLANDSSGLRGTASGRATLLIYVPVAASQHLGTATKRGGGDGHNPRACSDGVNAAAGRSERFNRARLRPASCTGQRTKHQRGNQAIENSTPAK